MPAELRSPRLAVLIDADNASAKIADGLFEEIAKIGEASVRRIYGDFSNARSRGWADILSKHAIIPQQQFAYTTGKNASDITLVIDAMDLLHSGRFDFPIAPVVVGLILGPIAESQLRRALAISLGDPMTLLQSPISATLLGIALVALLAPFVLKGMGRFKANED